MSYIRWGAKLPSGKKSRAFVIGEDTRLINVGLDKSISYVEMRRLFKTKKYNEIKNIVKKKLDLSAEEADYVCETLFDEHKKGKWDKPFDFEK